MMLIFYEDSHHGVAVMNSCSGVSLPAEFSSLLPFSYAQDDVGPCEVSVQEIPACNQFLEISTAMERAVGMTTPTKRQPESPTSRSRIRFSRSNIQSPLNTRGNVPVRLDDAGSPSRCREASPLTLPYVDLEAGKHGEKDISEEAVEMRTWSKGNEGGVSDKVDDFGARDVTPRRRTVRQSIPKVNLDRQARPPSFARSEFETIVRHLRNRSPYKAATSKPKFPDNLDYAWQFAGWGQLSYLDLTKQELKEAEVRLAVELDRPKLDQYRATSIAGNAVWGSVFYSLPAICAVADIYSPICMAVACSILFLFRPILLELGSAIRVDGASYVYLLNFTGKGWALCAAATTLVDAVATGVVSAATAASYIKGEVTLPFPDLVLTIIILAAFTGLLLFGVRESSNVTLGICALHCVTILILVITACVHWASAGSDVFVRNWQSSPSGGSDIARSIFSGICIGLLGVTGFESAPTYISIIRPEAYPAVLRNLILGALIINISVLIVTYAVLPSEMINNGANILSSVGQVAGGTWLRKIVVVDSAIVLCGGVLTGAVTTCSLVERLTADRALPALFKKQIPKTGSLWVACVLYLILCLVIYSASSFGLTQASNLFSMAFMAVLFSFAICGLVIKITRNRLKRSYHAPLAVVLSANIVILTAIAGNIAQGPMILALFAVALICVILVLLSYPKLTSFYGWFVYLCERSVYLSSQKRFHLWKLGAIQKIKDMKGQGVVVFMKQDTISAMVEALIYVRNNENTSRVAFVHAYDQVDDIPSELVANAKLVDEAFPDITVDLHLVALHGGFTPSLVEAVSSKLNVPKNLMFIGTISASRDLPYDLGDYGLRIFRS